MTDQIQCPECGSKLRRGSTFCIHCGNKIADNPELFDLPIHTDNEETVEDVLPSLEESVLEEIKEPVSTEVTNPVSETTNPEPSEDLTWEEEIPYLPQEEVSKIELTSDTTNQPIIEEVKEPRNIDDSNDLSWDEGIKEGMPFKEVAPPRVVAEADDMAVSTDDALSHLFPEMKDDATREAVTHLFPGGRGSTNPTFIDVVVGKPAKISIKTPLSELEHPSCPNCGITITSDGFEYPPYVFDAMGKARSDHADKLLKDNEHERAIEYYEMAKMLFEKSGNEKNIAEAIRRIDLGYDAMAQFHYDEAEVLLKEGNFEWAVVQFKKARELYMFTTDSKKRARCAERARDAYIEWGKHLESEGDQLAKESKTRDALSKYQDAAAKFREGGDTKRLRGLDKKIRKA
ncbi:hypothetical protein EU527_01085 [Candidatus Thorarchaeota archaeon]|nr:MAG: hypothetical protein EU527_01085 [Candidatus Thorarchaeota archaeon]